MPVFWGSCPHGVTRMYSLLLASHCDSTRQIPCNREAVREAKPRSLCWRTSHLSLYLTLQYQTPKRKRVFNRTFENRQERISQPFKKGENSLQIHGPNWWTSHLRTGLPRWQSRLLNQSFLNTLLSTRHHSKDVLRGIGELD